MKTTIFICFILLLGSYSFGQEGNFLMFPKPGMEYRYEITENSYLHNEEFRKLDELVIGKIVQIKCTESNIESNRILTVNILQNTVEKPDSFITKFKDYRYPEFKDGFYNRRNSDFYEGLLCRIEFSYIFNDENSLVKLDNREQVLLEVRSILNEKGYGKDEIDKRTSLFNKEAIPKLTEMLQSIYRVKQNITGSFHPEQTEYKSTFITTKDDILNITNRKWDVEPGIYMGNYSINLKEKYLLDYHMITCDSLKRSRHFRNVHYYFSAVENRMLLISKKDIVNNRFIISGKIENPQGKIITLAVLRKSYGTKMHLETVELDENNSFKIDTELKHAGLIYLQFGKTNHLDKRNILCFYAEPGSEMSFVAKGEILPWDVEITGDNIGASVFINDLRKDRKMFQQKIDWNTVGDYGYRLNYNDLLHSFDKFENFAENYRMTMSEETFEVVKNEIIAFYLCKFYRSYTSKRMYLTMLNGEYHNQGLEGVSITDIEAIIDAYNIHNIYNEYGIHSRQLAKLYLHHHFNKMKRVKEVRFADYKIAGGNVDFTFSSDIAQRVESTRSLLSGHVLYSQLADIFVSEVTKDERFVIQDRDYIFSKIDEYLDLIIRVVNDENFVDDIIELRKRNLQWQNDDYIPDDKFFNLKGEEKYFSDFFGEKPTVFYISATWDRERYYWDKLAEENPELNVVMVMSGNSFGEWTDYMERATPVAEQLLLINYDKKLLDVFLKNSKHYIAYDKSGKLIGIKDMAADIVKVAKDSLKPKKKELNKSQLKYIIIILVAILTALLIVLLIWKWRIRQRFRKEASNRKFRELELTAIRSQMNPHFLFNSLNSVQNLVQQNKGREAHLYLSDFAGLIRKVLNNSEKEEVSLAEELEMIGQYLNLEKLRFDFEFEVIVGDEIDRHNTLVPSMLLQPFVENAVIHGLQSKQGNKQLIIEVSKSDLGIKICIEDNGIGRDAAKQIAKTKNGKGTKLMQERLEILQEKQGEKYSLEIVDLEEGTRVEILIPEEK